MGGGHHVDLPSLEEEKATSVHLINIKAIVTPWNYGVEEDNKATIKFTISINASN